MLSYDNMVLIKIQTLVLQDLVSRLVCAYPTSALLLENLSL
jgi:hypothetical protein